jgi:hypothetical protein
MRNPMLVLVFVLAANASAWAQEPVKIEVYGGYSYTSADFSINRMSIGTGVTSEGLPAGWNASVTFFPLEEIGLTAEFGSHYGSEDRGPAVGTLDTKIQTYMFGPRLVERGERFEGFVHILGGLWRGVIDSNTGQQSDTLIAVGLGGGLELLFGHVGIRLFQADVFFCQLATSNPTFRAGAGASYRW